MADRKQRGRGVLAGLLRIAGGETEADQELIAPNDDYADFETTAPTSGAREAYEPGWYRISLTRSEQGAPPEAGRPMPEEPAGRLDKALTVERNPFAEWAPPSTPYESGAREGWAIPDLPAEPQVPEPIHSMEPDPAPPAYTYEDQPYETTIYQPEEPAAFEQQPAPYEQPPTDYEQQPAPAYEQGGRYPTETWETPAAAEPWAEPGPGAEPTADIPTYEHRRAEDPLDANWTEDAPEGGPIPWEYSDTEAGAPGQDQPWGAPNAEPPTFDAEPAEPLPQPSYDMPSYGDVLSYEPGAPEQAPAFPAEPDPGTEGPPLEDAPPAGQAENLEPSWYRITLTDQKPTDEGEAGAAEGASQGRRGASSTRRTAKPGAETKRRSFSRRRSPEPEAPAEEPTAPRRFSAAAEREARRAAARTAAVTSTGPAVEPDVVPESVPAAPPVEPAPAMPTPAPAASGPSLMSLAASDRRAALEELASRGLTDEDVVTVGVLVSDPERDIRVMAVRTLQARADAVTPDILRRALQDPTDEVRSAGVGLEAARQEPDVAALASLVAARRWPLTQQAALDVLPELVGRHGAPEAVLDAVLLAVAAMESSPVGEERAGFLALIRAVGRTRLIQALELPDDRRLGAVRLLLEEGSTESLRAVAGRGRDPFDEVRVAAGTARDQLAEDEPPAPEPVVAAEPEPILEPEPEPELVLEPEPEVVTAAQEPLVELAPEILYEPAPESVIEPVFEPEEAPVPALQPEPPVERVAPAPAPEPVIVQPEPEPEPAPERRATKGSRAKSRTTTVVENEIIAGLARALQDPDEGVRERAGRALGEVDRKSLLAWTRAGLAASNHMDAALAAGVAEAAGLTEVAGEILGHAAALRPDERGPLVGALSSFGLDAPELVALATSVDANGRPDAIRLLWQVAGRKVLPALRKLLGDTSGPVRVAVLDVFGESGDPSAIEVAHSVLESDSSPVVRATAIRVIGRAGLDQRAASLSQALDDPDPDVRATAVELLPHGMAGQAGELLLKALSDDDDRVWQPALRHLVSLPERDLPVLWRAIKQAPVDRRDQLISLLERTSHERLGLVSLDHLSSPDYDDRMLAISLAARSGTSEAVQGIIGTLVDPLPAVRRAGAAALAELRGHEAIPALTQALNDPDAGVREEALRTLSAIDDERVLEPLINALKDPEEKVREVAMDALIRWSSPAVARRLVEALTSPVLRRPASELLARMGGAAVDPLVNLLREGHPDIAATVGDTLERLVGRDVFLQRLGSMDPADRLGAVEALGAMGGLEAVEGLSRALSDPNEDIRIRALRALGEIGDPSAIDAVRRSAHGDPVPEVAAAAEEALRKLQA